MTRTVSHVKALVGALFLLAVAACSGGSDQPSDTDIKNAIAFRMPAGIEVTGVDIQVSENAGSKVEPLIRDRSKVTFEFADDFVTVVTRYGDKYILKKVFSKGQEITGTVLTSSRLKGESWAVNIDRMDMPAITGKGLSQYVEGSYALEGTDEAATIKTQYEERMAAEQQARMEARAKQEAERLAALEKAAQDKAGRIAAFRETMAGTWAAKSPLMHNGGIYVSSNDARATGGIEVTFPKGTEASGVAKVTLYVFDDPIDHLTVDAGFVVKDDGKSAQVSIRSNKLRTLDFYFGGGAWTFDPSGLLDFRGSSRWSVQLEKDGPVLAKKRELEAYLTKKKAASEALMVKYRAGLAPSTFRNIGLNDNTYIHLFVTAKSGGDRKVYGDGNTYYYDSSIALAAIHAGLLREGEAGIVKITRRHSNNNLSVQATVRNGVQAGSYRDSTHYSIELVEKLTVK